MVYAFTDEDKELLGAVSGRDPLGILPVWQYRARDVVPHLTAASRELSGFHVLLVALAWWPEFATQHSQPVRDLEKYFLLVEQAFARACNTQDGQWPLPGTRRLGAGGTGVWIGLAPSQHLLGGQLPNGTWGIYRSAAISAGFMDDKNNVNAELAAKIKESTGCMKLVMPFVKEAMGKGDGEVWIAKQRNHRLVGDLSKIIKKYPLANLLCKPLLNPSVPQVTAQVVALMRLQRNKDDFECQAFVLNAMTNIPDYQEVFQHILHCEHYLATVEAVFEWLCSGESSSVKKAAQRLPVIMDVDALKAAKRDFLQSGDYGLNTLAAKRKTMMESLDLSNNESFLSTLIQQHGEVSAARNNDPWISILETGRFDVRVSTGKPADTQLDPATSWRNGYYLPSLFNLVKQFHEGGRRK
jgi:hypothetical protein